MAKYRTVRDLTRYMMAARSQILKAHADALLRTTLDAEKRAKENVSNWFGKTGSQRRLSGRLLNSVFHGFDIRAGQSLPTGFIGTRGIPYGRIHELGGTIVPKKAKQLWVKNTYDAQAYKFNRRMTPRQWFSLFQKSHSGAATRDPATGRFRRKDQRVEYKFGFGSDGKPYAAGVEENDEFIPLFFLRDQVEIPAKKYLTIAARHAVLNYEFNANKTLRQALRARFFR